MNKKSFVIGMFLALAFTGGMVLYCENFPSNETRQEISVDGLFLD